jgi:hypothetical protein
MAVYCASGRSLLRAATDSCRRLFLILTGVEVADLFSEAGCVVVLWDLAFLLSPFMTASAGRAML